MPVWRTLDKQYAMFEAIQNRIIANSASTDAGWKTNLVRLRRDLQDQLAEVLGALKACEAEGSDVEGCRTLANHLSKLRSTMAYHQAQWPAVMIDTDNPAYKQSVVDLRDVTVTFRAATKAFLDGKLRR